MEKYEAKFMVYGCNGFIGKQIVETAIKRGLETNIIIAGRNKKSVEEICKINNLSTEQCRVFSLYDKKIDENFKDIKVLMNVAGPHVDTYEPLLNACLRNKVHYLDINAELDVFENIANFDSKAKESNIIIIPGCGITVPSDCLSSLLNEKIEKACELEIVFGADKESGPRY
jgi:short subunit dehydrogenase-like uncharacterized protein